MPNCVMCTPPQMTAMSGVRIRKSAVTQLMLFRKRRMRLVTSFQEWRRGKSKHLSSTDAGAAATRPWLDDDAGRADDDLRAVGLFTPDVEMKAAAGALGDLAPDLGPAGDDVLAPDDVYERYGHLSASMPSVAELIGQEAGDEAERHHSLDDDVRKAERLRHLAVRMIVL